MMKKYSAPTVMGHNRKAGENLNESEAGSVTVEFGFFKKGSGELNPVRLMPLQKCLKV